MGADPDDPLRITDQTRFLGLVVSAGTRLGSSGLLLQLSAALAVILWERWLRLPSFCYSG